MNSNLSSFISLISFDKSVTPATNTIVYLINQYEKEFDKALVEASRSNLSYEEFVARFRKEDITGDGVVDMVFWNLLNDSTKLYSKFYQKIISNYENEDVF